MRIGRLRKHLKDKKWREHKLDALAEEAESWNYFNKFHCDPFFVGKLQAQRNYLKYEKNMNRINKHFNFISKQNENQIS
jgi:hypothetical protein